MPKATVTNSNSSSFYIRCCVARFPGICASQILTVTAYVTRDWHRSYRNLCWLSHFGSGRAARVRLKLCQAQWTSQVVAHHLVLVGTRWTPVMTRCVILYSHVLVYNIGPALTRAI